MYPPSHEPKHKGVGVGSLVSSADVGNGNGILTVEGTVCLSEFMAALTDIVIGKDTANVDDQALSEVRRSQSGVTWGAWFLRNLPAKFVIALFSWETIHPKTCPA